ncbi:unnamed protein product [Dibothriocephalus latus]|uniref:EGF-like domain-containing protein n=1 Tax=Dibothriocephalus latus TaxID=60516 RepID=A0A3P7MF60_DIBLA|nr:unnamed protein product [Dibothriocephalus latus]
MNPFCKDGKTCVNIPGGYRCIAVTDCPAGFKRDSIREPCTDIDECATGIAKCGPNMHCENTIGSYRCLCQRGYKNVNDTACVGISFCRTFDLPLFASLCSASVSAPTSVENYTVTSQLDLLISFP